VAGKRQKSGDTDRGGCVRLGLAGASLALTLGLSACTFIYYRAEVALSPPPGRSAVRALEVADLKNGSAEPTAFEVGAAFLAEEKGQGSVVRLAEAVERLEVRLVAQFGRVAEYHRLFTGLDRLLLRMGRETEGSRNSLPYDVLAAAEGRSRNCLALSLLYLMVSEDLGLPARIVLVRGHTLVSYDDGLSREYYETTGGFFYTPKRLRRRFFPVGGVPSWCLRPLSGREVAAVVLANRALLRAREAVDKSLKDLDLAAELFPGLPQTYVNRGYILECEGRMDEALEAYNQALGLDRHHPFALNNLASLFLRREERLEEGLRAARRAVALMPREEAFVTTMRSLEEALAETGE
jgi:tetratricopeptide (TPR) repeat protein